MMRVQIVALAVLTALVAAAAPAVAGTGGVIVQATGPWREPVRSAAIAWMQKRDIEIRPDPLSSRDAEALARCYKDDNEACAASIASRAAVDQLVLLVVTLEPGKGGDPDVKVGGWQFAPDGRVVAFDVKHCEACRTKSVTATTQSLLDSLERLSASLDQRGTLRIESTPPGAVVVVDDFSAGVTPLTYKVRPGSHVIRLELSGYITETKEIAVGAGQAADVNVALRPIGGGPVPPPPGGPVGGGGVTRGVPGVWPWAVGGAGVAAVIVGTVLIVKDSPAEEDGRQHQTYWPTGTAGIVVTSVGVAAVATGVYFAFIHERAAEKAPAGGAPGPTIGVDASGTLTLGYQGRF